MVCREEDEERERERGERLPEQPNPRRRREICFVSSREREDFLITLRCTQSFVFLQVSECAQGRSKPLPLSFSLLLARDSWIDASRDFPFNWDLPLHTLILHIPSSVVSNLGRRKKKGVGKRPETSKLRRVAESHLPSSLSHSSER